MCDVSQKNTVFIFMKDSSSVPHALTLPIAQTNNCQNGDQHGSNYIRVDREWDKGDEVGPTEIYETGNSQAPNQIGSMLQRWQQENIRDQPYHNLESVKKEADYLCNDEKG